MALHTMVGAVRPCRNSSSARAHCLRPAHTHTHTHTQTGTAGTASKQQFQCRRRPLVVWVLVPCTRGSHVMQLPAAAIRPSQQVCHVSSHTPCVHEPLLLSRALRSCRTCCQHATIVAVEQHVLWRHGCARNLCQVRFHQRGTCIVGFRQQAPAQHSTAQQERTGQTNCEKACGGMLGCQSLSLKCS